MSPIGAGEDSGDFVTLLICGGESNDSDLCTNLHDFDEIAISTADIGSWDLPSLPAHKVLRIEVDAKRLIEKSSYFRGLLSGSFSEARENSVSIHWDVESFVAVLRVIFGCHVEITSDNFIDLNEAALFFGVELLILKCQVWLDKVTSASGGQSPQLCLDGLIHIWKYGVEHANDCILQRCISYLGRNFMWASSLDSFKVVPEKLLCSCIQHPDLTVDSEKHFCDVILFWLKTNAAKLDGLSSNDLCNKIRTSLLPLWFAAGKQSCPLFSTSSFKATEAILCLARIPGISLTGFSREGGLRHLRLRLTKYTQKVDISGCPQMTAGLFLISLFSSLGQEWMLKKNKNFVSSHANSFGPKFLVSEVLDHVLPFEAVHELDISNCPSLSLDSVIDVLSKSFPSLRTLRAAYFINFKTKRLCQLVQKFPLLENIDLTLDIGPVIPGQVSIIAAPSVATQLRSTSSSNVYNYHTAVSLSCTSKLLPSNLTKLSLVGRSDVDDSDLLIISDVCPSLNYVDIRGCICITDSGISIMILKCKMLHSLLVCGTSFGTNSIMALLSVSSETEQTSSTAYQLQVLHIGCCHEVNGKTLSMLMAGANHLTSLCLREIHHIDDALYEFSGTSLKILDVSDTKVSGCALSRVIRRNPCLKSLKTRGCWHLLRHGDDAEERKLHNSSDSHKEWYSELGRSCKLEEIELGWGISFFSLEALKPAIGALKTLVVGLGGSLGDDGLKLLPSVCQMLETLILYFQEISDSALMGIMRTLPRLQCLALCYCFGDMSSLSLKFRMPTLRILKLERVAPWMTNEELATLAENCVNLVELSLTGCALLDSEAQAIISSGWPGLTTLRLEECGKITTSGAESLLDCHALEDLTLRHTGPGISRYFILRSATKLPMLRKISLDLCDAEEGDFDLPNFSNRWFLAIVKISRCKIQKTTLDLHKLEPHRTPVHKETLVLTWNSNETVTTVVKERL